MGNWFSRKRRSLDWELTHKLLKQKDIGISFSQLQQILDAELALQNNQSLGGTSPAEVSRMIDGFEEQLNEIAMHIYACQIQIEDAQKETLRIVDEVLSNSTVTTDGE